MIQKLYIIITLCFLWQAQLCYGQTDSLEGVFTYTVRPHPKSVYHKYTLNLNKNGLFQFEIYDEQFCYNSTYMVAGKWTIKDSIISFFDINYEYIPEGEDTIPDFKDHGFFMKKEFKDSLPTQDIVIIEKDFPWENIDENNEFFILALDQELNILELISPHKINLTRTSPHYLWPNGKEEPGVVPEEVLFEGFLTTQYRIPSNSYLIVYSSGYPLKKVDLSMYSENGINVILDDNNYFTLTKGGFIHSGIKLKVIDNNNLKSLKPIRTGISEGEIFYYKRNLSKETRK